MKRKFLVAIITIAVCSSIVGCGNKADISSSLQKENQIEQSQNKDLKSAIKTHFKIDEAGFEYSYPDEWKQCAEKDCFGTVIDGSKDGYIKGHIITMFSSIGRTREVEKMYKDNMEINKEKEKKLESEYPSLNKGIFEIFVFDKSKEKSMDDNEKKVKEKSFSLYKYKDKVAEKGNLQYYFCYNDTFNEKGMKEEDKKEYKEIFKGIKYVKNSIKTFKPVSREELEKQNTEKMKKNKLQFTTKTIAGKKIDSSILKNSKLTMVNIWATTCGSCIEEMPEIQKLADEYKEKNVNVIGIVLDAEDTENIEIAKKIIEKKGVKFTNIVPDEKLNNGILKDVSCTPTTIFFDDKGNIVGNPILGAQKDEYKKAIERILKN